MMWGALLLVLAAPLAGGLIVGADRVLTARLQGRFGPPLLQPFYDVIKLWNKDTVVTSGRQSFFVYAHLVWMLTALILLATGQDFLVFVFALAAAEVFLTFAGFSTHSPYSHIGSSRELFQMLSAEPVLLFVAFALYVKNGTFLSGAVFRESPLLFSYPLVFLAVLYILTIKMRKSPFDISSGAHAHQELVRGVTTDISGRYLALTEIAHWLELVIVLYIVYLFWAAPWYAGVLLAAAAFGLEIIIDNLYARMRLDWMVAASWTVGFTLCLVNLFFNIATRKL
ncbi:MAG: respiratory chain complex I subunit 1 family protein [Solirubrobacterales bacterium]